MNGTNHISYVSYDCFDYIEDNCYFGTVSETTYYLKFSNKTNTLTPRLITKSIEIIVRLKGFTSSITVT